MHGTRASSRSMVIALGLLMLCSQSGAQVAVDPALPVYLPIQGVDGGFKSVGSDTMNNLMTLWGEAFLKYYPNIQIEVEGKGSSTAPPALIAGTATFGPMSRPMKESEIDAFERKYGYPPTELPVGVDMLALYVHKDNPIASLTLPRVDAMFSKSRRGGFPKEIRLWGELGLEGEWANQPISLYGRNAASGTYGFFKDHAIFGGDFKDSVKEQPGSSSVVQGVASDRNGIGYSGIGYRTADVRAIPLAEADGSAAIEVDPSKALTGEYPLCRFLLLSFNHRPLARLDPLPREFLRYLYSQNGQREVIRDGYLPVSANIARQALESVGIEPGF